MIVSDHLLKLDAVFPVRESCRSVVTARRQIIEQGIYLENVPQLASVATFGNSTISFGAVNIRRGALGVSQDFSSELDSE